MFAHLPLLRLPYFWDEAGYYIPAARDFLLHGWLIPQSTITNAHTPLPLIYLALWWKSFGFAPIVTRVAALVASAFGLAQFYRVGTVLANRPVAIATTALFALYPVFFSQSSLAHSDTFATALLLWGLREYFEGWGPRAKVSLWRMGCAFSLAALAKETAIVVPAALAVFKLARAVLKRRSLPDRTENISRPRSLGTISNLLALVGVPGALLALWFGYHFHRTGHVFGNPYYFRYNVTQTLSLPRFLLAFLQRCWMTLGHMNLFLLTGAAGAAMLLVPLRDESANGPLERRRIAIDAQLAMLAVVLGDVAFHSAVGGALLARYTLVPVALVMLIAVSTLRRRVRKWPYLAVACGACFVCGWFISPPYGFAPEDNLRYVDYVRVHQDAAKFLGQHYSHAEILTAWPAVDELAYPYLGYVSQPIATVKIENFSYQQMRTAQQNPAYDAVMIFSTKQDPKHLMRFAFWERAKARYFDDHQDLSPDAAAQMLGGRVVWQEKRRGEWAAVIDVPRARLALAAQPAAMWRRVSWRRRQ